ncbi:MAG: helix-turn-helix transcriptional regulator [Candidatus Metalachnospira sp.]|nr:helix-turn-helix transcriptional regulator [Candidatus Metalachnospira sp.]
MRISYNKLWKMLIDKSMIKKDLRLATGITSNMMAKPGKNESVPVEVLIKICNVLDCGIDDIMEMLQENEQSGTCTSEKETF